MKRVIPLVLLLVFVWGCERAGPDAAWALQAVPDTIEARRENVPLPRLTAGGIAPAPNGTDFVGIADHGDLAVGSLDGTVRHLAPTRREAPWGAPPASERGELIAFLSALGGS
jgi:hypothetical protein